MWFPKCTLLICSCWLFNLMFLFWTVKYINCFTLIYVILRDKCCRIWPLELIWVSVMSYHNVVVCLLQAWSKFAGSPSYAYVTLRCNVCSRFARSLPYMGMWTFAANLQQIAWWNLHDESVYSSIPAAIVQQWILLCNILNICCRQAAINAGNM